MSVKFQPNQELPKWVKEPIAESVFEYLGKPEKKAEMGFRFISLDSGNIDSPITGIRVKKLIKLRNLRTGRVERVGVNEGRVFPDSNGVYLVIPTDSTVKERLKKFDTDNPVDSVAIEKAIAELVKADAKAKADADAKAKADAK